MILGTICALSMGTGRYDATLKLNMHAEVLDAQNLRHPKTTYFGFRRVPRGSFASPFPRGRVPFVDPRDYHKLPGESLSPKGEPLDFLKWGTLRHPPGMVLTLHPRGSPGSKSGPDPRAARLALPDPNFLPRFSALLGQQLSGAPAQQPSQDPGQVPVDVCGNLSWNLQNRVRSQGAL